MKSAAATPDLGTVIAMAVVAGACATLLHEGLGHGGACVLSGGHNLVISTVNESCSVSNRWIDAAGTLVNLGAGALCWAWMQRARSAHGRYFLWLLTAFNLLTGAGYFLFSGIGGIGDWAQVIAGMQPAWAWRTGMAIGGGVLYAAVLALLLRELAPFLPEATEARMQRARRLMLVPYFSYGILSVVAGLVNPVGAVLIAESAAASAFGGASGLWWGMPYLRYWRQLGGALSASGRTLPRIEARTPSDQRERPGQKVASHPRYGRGGETMTALSRSRRWLIAGVIAAVVFIAVVGPGVSA